MNVRGPIYGRQDNTEKIRTYIRDTEHTMTYSPNDYSGNKFFGTWNKLLNMQNILLYENKEKYLNEYQTRFNARLEIGALPKCFGTCINDIEVSAVGLTSDEKNCLRECYLRRVSSRDDMNMLFQQKLATENMRDHREFTV